MKLTICALAACALTAGAAMADDVSSKMKGEEIPVTLTGCLHKATQRDAYVMTGISETTGAKVPVDAIYRLKDRSKFKDHVGHQITIMGSAKMIKAGEVEMEQKPRSGGAATSMEVEADGVEAELITTTGKEIPPMAPATVAGQEKKVSAPTYRVKISEVKMVGACS
jgi:hypothetical protein